MNTELNELHADEHVSQPDFGQTVTQLETVYKQAKSAFESFGSSLKLPEQFPHFSISDLSKSIDEFKQSALKNLYGDSKNFKDSIVPDACVQPDSIGNCYFVAALASLAKTDPQSVLDMIKVNANGTFTVKFPGATKEVTVDKPTDSEIEQVHGRTKYGVWPLVLMKAYGKYCGGGKSDLDGSDGGSLLSAGVAVLTSKGVVNEGLGRMIPLMSWKSLDTEMKDALNPANRKDALPVTASTSKTLYGGEATVDGFVRGHVYSVLEYKPDASNIKQGKVAVRNPWGGADATRVITMEQFCANFLQLSIPKR